jgi:hypothetical protein
VAKQPASITRHFLDEFAIDGFINSFSLAHNQETPPVTCLSDVGPRRVPGNYDHMQDFMGFGDFTTLLNDARYHALVGDDNDHYFGSMLDGNVAAGVAYEYLSKLADKPLSGQTGGGVVLGIKASGSGGMYRGIVLASAAVVGVGNQAGQNQGATISGQVYAVTFRITAFVGTNITLTIQSSTDNGAGDAYSAVAGLNDTFTLKGVSRKTTTAATEAGKRVAITGTFTSATIHVTAGVVVP